MCFLKISSTLLDRGFFAVNLGSGRVGAMTSDGRAHYTALSVVYEKGGLELSEMVLPPLQTSLTSKSWRRKVMISMIALTIIAALITTIVCGVSLTIGRGKAEESTKSLQKSEPEKQIKSELNFQVDLRRAYEKIMDMKKPEDLIKDFEYYTTELDDVRISSDLRDFLAVLGLKGIEYNFSEEDVRYAKSTTKELHEWYTYLCELKLNLTAYDVQKTLGNLNMTQGFRMDGRRRKELSDLLTEWTEPLSVNVSRSRTVFKKRVILISEVLKMLKTKPELLKKDIYVFASGVMYLDEDILLPETNLALITPIWSFVKGINIFMSGLDGAKHKYNAAIAGEHGLPGRRGGNGGYFFGVGNMTADELQIRTDGGNGSDGQHGTNGRDGTLTKPEGFTSTEPFRCKKPINDIRNIYGEVITYYEVYHEYGCGGNGTDGGAGGPGGEGGRIVLVNMTDGSVKGKSGSPGASGKGGKGGAGGQGASWGCRFYAEGAENGNLQQVTKEVCGFFMPSGVPGRDAWNTAGMEKPDRRKSSFFADALREFRTYAREEYMKDRRDVWRLVEKLDVLDIFDNETIIRDFVDEMNGIGKMGRVEFYESLNRRIEKAMEGPWNKEVLTQLRTLSYGKALSLKNGIDNYVIVDLDMFLEKVSDDLESTDKRTTIFKDHTTPIFIQLLKGKMNHFSDALDRWLYKSSKLIAGYDVALSRKPVSLPEQIDGRNMAYLTSLTAKVIKSLSSAVLVYPGEVTANISSVDITLNDFMIHKDSKTSTGRFCRHRSQLLKELKFLSDGSSDWKPHLRNVKRLMEVLNNLVDPQSEVSDFPVLLDYFESTAGLLETVRQKRTFSEYVAEINSFNVVSDEVKTIRGYLYDTLITAQYRNALSVFRQWVFPHMSAYESLLPKNKTLTLKDARTGIAALRKSVKEYKSTITTYDKYIREAVFSSNNSVGEYYKWHNDDIRLDLKELFKGRMVALTADVENSHMLSKNAIKFRTVQLEFQSRRDGLSAMMTNVQIEMRHSGYSYYYYNGRSYLQTGEGLDLRYSYETTASGIPVNFNMVYKKLMDGPPIFSPYTTWNVRLNSIPDNLVNFADDVDVALIGLGSYIEVVDNVSEVSLENFFSIR